MKINIRLKYLKLNDNQKIVNELWSIILSTYLVIGKKLYNVSISLTSD